MSDAAHLPRGGFPFRLKLEQMADPRPPQHSVRDLAAVAARLGVTVETTINGTPVFAVPGESAEDVLLRWEGDQR